MAELADLTTLRIGGPARRFVVANSTPELVKAVADADASGEPVLVLGGGSNLVVADAGFDGTVVAVRTRGIERRPAGGRVLVTVAAGEPWDDFVKQCVGAGLAGIECLSGIPGLVGATPIQNVGAYGQDVSETVVAVRVWDRERGSELELAAADCHFGYRSSRFKREPGRWVVLSVSLAVARESRSRPIRYAELARALGVELGASAPLTDVRAAVLGLRRRKGMVLDADDPDSVSAGSFFTNPILEPDRFEELDQRTRQIAGPAPLPRFDEPDGRVKTSAAWLVEQAGFGRGYGLPGPAAISLKHTLALTNRGGATAADLLALAREVADGVCQAFGVELIPEPVLVGLSWAPLAAR